MTERPAQPEPPQPLNTPNERVRKQAIKDSEKVQEERVKQAQGKLAMNFEKYRTDRFKAAEALARDTMNRKIIEISQEWTAARKRLDTGKASPAEITELNERMASLLDEAVGMMVSHLRQMAAMSENKKMTAEQFVKMSQGLDSVIEILRFKEHEELMWAVKGIMGVKQPGRMPQKPEIYQIFSEYYGREDLDPALRSTLWGIIIMQMSHKEIEDFMLVHTASMEYEELKVFIDDVAIKGVPYEVIKNVVDARKPDFSEEQLNYFYSSEERYRTAYRVVEEVFLRQARYLKRNSYNNPALRMITGGNLLRLCANIGAVLTMAANGLSAVFNKGKFHSPIEAVGNLMRNTYFLGAGGLMIAMHRGTPAEYKEDKLAARTDMTRILDSQHEYNSFFHDSDHNYAGAKALVGYIAFMRGNDDTKVDPNKASISGFIEYLEEETKRHPDDQEVKDTFARARSLQSVDDPGSQYFRKLVWSVSLLGYSDINVGRQMDADMEFARSWGEEVTPPEQVTE